MKDLRSVIILYCVDDGALAQVTQRGCRISSLEIFKSCVKQFCPKWLDQLTPEVLSLLHHSVILVSVIQHSFLSQNPWLFFTEAPSEEKYWSSKHFQYILTACMYYETDSKCFYWSLLLCWLLTMLYCIHSYLYAKLQSLFLTSVLHSWSLVMEKSSLSLLKLVLSKLHVIQSAMHISYVPYEMFTVDNSGLEAG